MTESLTGRLIYAAILQPLNPFRAGSVFKRQNLTYKDGPRNERIKVMAVDP